MVGSVALGVLLACGLTVMGMEAQGQTKPNIVFVLTDDQFPGTENAMPALKNNVTSQGVKFTNMISTFPLCCPGRATIHARAVRPQHPDLRQLASRRGVGEVQGHGVCTTAPWPPG